MQSTDVSLIVPIYNGEAFLKRSLLEMDAALRLRPERWELILVLDAPTDGSEAICREFQGMHRPYTFKILVNEKNLGKGGAIQKGMEAAQGSYCLFNDCDLAYPMSGVFRILEALQSGHELAVASRSLPESRYVFSPKNFRYLYTRHVASRILNFLIQKVFIPKVRDTQAGLKGFHGPVAKFLFGQLKLRGFSFDLELLYIAYRAGIPVTEVAVDLYAQRVSTVNFPLESVRMLRDIFRILVWTVQGQYQFDYSSKKLPAARVS